MRTPEEILCNLREKEAGCRKVKMLDSAEELREEIELIDHLTRELAEANTRTQQAFDNNERLAVELEEIKKNGKAVADMYTELLTKHADLLLHGDRLASLAQGGVPDEIIKWIRTEPSERGISGSTPWEQGYRTAWATLSVMLEATPSAPPSEHEGAAEDCPECKGAEVRGFKRGVICVRCNGAGSVEAPPATPEKVGVPEFANTNDQLQAAHDSMMHAIESAYGHLWHVNNEPGTPQPDYSPEKAAYAARKILYDMLTHERRGIAINRIGRELGFYSPSPPSTASAEVSE